MHSFNPDEVRILYSPNTRRFAQRVKEHLSNKLDHSVRGGLGIYPIEMQYFNSREYKPKAMESVREKKTYVIHDFSDQEGNYEPNHGYIKLFLIGDALRRASPQKTTFILPHMGYQRQDRLDEERVPISFKAMMDAFVATTQPMPTGLVTFDMHAGQEQGFSNLPTDNLYASPLFAEYIKKDDSVEKCVVVSPDVGGATRARGLAKRIGTEIAICDKRRESAGKAEIMHVVGNVKGKKCKIVDDVIDTSRTALKSYTALLDNGAEDVEIYSTHAICSRDLADPEWVPESEFKKIGVKVKTTDTIPRKPEYYQDNRDWMTVLSVAPMVASAIFEIQTGGSVSKIFKPDAQYVSELLRIL